MLHKNCQYFYKILFKGVIALFLLFSLFIASPLALAKEEITQPNAQADALKILTNTGTKANLTTTNSPTTYQIIGSIINWILSLVGILFFGLIIYGGLTWMMAGGNDEKISQASSILRQSILGLIVVVLAFLLTNFVVFKFITVFTK